MLLVFQTITKKKLLNFLKLNVIWNWTNKDMARVQESQLLFEMKFVHMLPVTIVANCA